MSCKTLFNSATTGVVVVDSDVFCKIMLGGRASKFPTLWIISENLFWSLSKTLPISCI